MIRGLGGISSSDPMGVGEHVQMWMNGEGPLELNSYLYGLANPLRYTDPYGLWSIGDPLPQGVVDFSAGMGDALLLGFGDDLRDMAGIDGGVDPCSNAYRYGGWTSFAAGGTRLAYAGIAKGYSMVASSGAAASAFRAQLKNVFRLGMGKNWRPPNLANKTDAELLVSAGKTNRPLNLYGAGVAGAGAYEGSGCGCSK